MCTLCPNEYVLNVWSSWGGEDLVWDRRPCLSACAVLMATRHWVERLSDGGKEKNGRKKGQEKSVESKLWLLPKSCSGWPLTQRLCWTEIIFLGIALRNFCLHQNINTPLSLLYLISISAKLVMRTGLPKITDPGKVKTKNKSRIKKLFPLQSFFSLRGDQFSLSSCGGWQVTKTSLLT